MGVLIYFYKLKLEISENMELSEKNEKKAETPSLEQSPDKRDDPVKVQIVCPTMCGETSGPAVLPCSACETSVWSTVSSSTSTFGWVWFSLCYCCCLGCAFLPFCSNDFKVFNHKCRKCGLLLKSDEPQIANWKKTMMIIGLIIASFLAFVILPYMCLKYLNFI